MKRQSSLQWASPTFIIQKRIWQYGPYLVLGSSTRCTVATATIEADKDKENDKCAEYSTGGVGENLAGDFNDLVGTKTFGLDGLNYFSDDDDAYYHQEIEDEECVIKYYNAKKVTHGQRQTNVICGSPQPPDYSGMNSAKLAEAKKEYTRERKWYTDSLRMKRLQYPVITSR